MSKIIILSIVMGMSVFSLYGQKVLNDTANEEKNKDSVVNIAFGKVLKRTAVNDIDVISPSESEMYDHVINVDELLGGRIPGLIGGTNIRGLGGALIVIDGVPGSLSLVNVNEVEQVTVLKDANSSALYGVQGSRGVIMIKTKHGVPHKNMIRGTFENGFSTPVSYPRYLGAAEYMKLYNEALENDGLPPLYSATTISETESGLNPVRYPDVNYFNSGFLKTAKPNSRLQGEFSGGSNNAQYYLNIGWLHDGSIMNQVENQHTDRFNLRSNIDLKINNFIKSHVGVLGIFDIANTVAGDFFSDASMLRPNTYTLLIDTSLVGDKELIDAAKLIKGKYLLGGSSIYQTNPYGYLYLNGLNKQLGTSVQFRTGLDFNLGSITKGLGFKTNMVFDYYNQYVESQGNTFAVYQPNWNNNILSLTKIGEDQFTGIQNIESSFLSRKITFFGALNYQRIFNKYHAVSASVIGFADKYNEASASQDDKHANLGARFNYVYMDKYIFDFNSAVVSSAKLAPGHKTAFSPSLGLGWVLSEEEFLKNSRYIDFLKLRVSGGIINTDIDLGYFGYENIFGSGTSFSWGDNTRTNSTTVITTSGNTNLFYEKRKEVNLGFNSVLFNKTLQVNAGFFQDYVTDMFAVLVNSIPTFLGGFNPTQNYGEYKYSGVELGINWKKSINDFNVGIGSTMLFTKSEVLKTDEFWQEDYLYRAGKPVSSIWGLEAEGLFQNDADIASHAVQAFGGVQPGDIKYKDQNNDGVVNEDDNVMIGNDSPTFVGGLTIKLSYRNFTLFALGTIKSGSQRLYTNSYYWLYGDRKYSVIARDRWTPATAATATYPRLSSQASSNNFRNSTFWLYDNSTISLARLQLSYEVPTHFASKLYTKGLNFYLRASNIANFSKNRDRQQLNIGGEPQYRFFAAGLNAQF